MKLILLILFSLPCCLFANGFLHCKSDNYELTITELKRSFQVELHNQQNNEKWPREYSDIRGLIRAQHFNSLNDDCSQMKECHRNIIDGHVSFECSRSKRGMVYSLIMKQVDNDLIVTCETKRKRKKKFSLGGLSISKSSSSRARSAFTLGEINNVICN